jgi:hypothetical protein
VKLSTNTGKIRIPKFKTIPEERINGNHPPLISEELFYKANDVLKGRRRNTDFKSDTTDIYPLIGIFKCPVHVTSLTAYSVPFSSPGQNPTAIKKLGNFYSILCTKGIIN